MAPGDRQVLEGDLNIGGQVVSTLHKRPRKTTHYNTIRAEYRARNGKTTRPYITISRNRIHQMRDTGNIIPLEKGHMKLSPQARKAMNIILSNPELTSKEQTKCVNKFAGVLTRRSITRDRSILEVAADVTESFLSSKSSRVARQPTEQNVSREPEAGPPIPGGALQESVQPLLQLTNDESNEVTEEPPISDILLVEKHAPTQRPPVPRTITRHGTEIFCGLVTPGNSPSKASGNYPIPPVIERDVEMDDTTTGDHDHPLTPSPGPAPRETEPQSNLASALNDELLNLRREKEYVLRVLSRNGQGTFSNLETVANRAVQQREELRVENQELRAFIERLKSGIIDLQGKIAHVQGKLDRAESDRIEMAQSRRRWIAKMWAIAGRVPGGLRKKDAEIENMREKLVSLHTRLAQEQSQLRELQDQLEEETTRRVGAETKLDDSRTAHAQAMKDRDLAGQRLRDQLKHMADSLDSGAVSI